MTKPIEIKSTDRSKLTAIFNTCQYDRVLIDSVLEGLIGEAFADSAINPTVARLDSGSFTMLGGDPTAPLVKDLLCRAPITYITPQTAEWKQTIVDELSPRVTAMPFTSFSADSIEMEHLISLIQTLPAIFQLKQIDKVLAERVPSDIGNEWFFENFHSIDDFHNRGIGFCILHHDVVVGAATSTSQSQRAIDIEIETVADYRRQGLATVAGAQLVKHCLEQGIKPRWFAANPESERLALKLGYLRDACYETLELDY